MAVRFFVNCITCCCRESSDEIVLEAHDDVETVRDSSGFHPPEKAELGQLPTREEIPIDDRTQAVFTRCAAVHTSRHSEAKSEASEYKSSAASRISFSLSAKYDPEPIGSQNPLNYPSDHDRKGESHTLPLPRILECSYPSIKKKIDPELLAARTVIEKFPATFCSAETAQRLLTFQNLRSSIQRVRTDLKTHLTGLPQSDLEHLKADSATTIPYLALVEEVEQLFSKSVCMERYFLAIHLSLRRNDVPMVPETIHTSPLFREIFLRSSYRPVAGEIIGKGSFGFVYPITIGPHQIVCKRTYDVDQRENPLSPEEIKSVIRRSLKEIAVLFCLPEHQNLCGPLYCVVQKKRTSLFFEKADCDLESMNKASSKSRITIPHFIRYLSQILTGLQVLHSTRFRREDGTEGIGIVHSDIKPANILLGNDGFIKIADFGFAGLVGQRIRGYSIHYRPPEHWRPGAALSTSNDIWSLGILCCVILTGKSPFRSSLIGTTDFFDQSKVDEALDKSFIEPKIRRNFGEIDPHQKLQRFVKRCLRINPAERPTALELLRDSLFTQSLMEKEPIDSAWGSSREREPLIDTKNPISILARGRFVASE